MSKRLMALLFPFVLGLAACNPESGSSPVDAGPSQTPMADENEAFHLKQLEDLGYDRNAVIRVPGGYRVEGHLTYTSGYLDSLVNPAPLAKTAQGRRRKNLYSVKSNDRTGMVTVYLGWSHEFPEMGPNWKAAMREAMANWNAVTGTSVFFKEVFTTEGQLGIFASTDFIWWGDWSQSTECAEAYPTMDAHINSLRVVLNQRYESSASLSHAARVKAAMHVLGDALNFGHTDQVGTTLPDGSNVVHIAGTPTMDANSLFLTNHCGTTSQFSAGDYQAIRNLYPSGIVLHQRPNYRLASDGGTLLWDDMVTAFQQEDEMIVALTYNRDLIGKIGRDGTWVGLLNNVMKFTLQANGTIGALQWGGQLYAKQSNMHGAWQWQSNNVKTFDIAFNRVAAVTTSNELYVKESLSQSNQSWTFVASGVSTVQLENNRLCYLTMTGNYLYCQEVLDVSTRKLIRGGVDEYQMEGNFVLARVGADLYGIDVPAIGSWNGTLNYLTGDIKKFHADGQRIGVIKGTNDQMWIKIGLHGTWVSYYYYWKDFRIKGQYITGITNNPYAGLYTTYDAGNSWIRQEGATAEALWQYQ